MAQIKKHESGGTVAKKEESKNSFVNKPVESKPVIINPLTFMVDGQEHQIAESDFNAIADKAFTEEVRKGQAKLKDRSKWMGAFQTKLQEAKTGRFNIQSSGDALGNLSYTPGDASYDGSASDGIGENGEAAQRTGIGKIIAPKASGSTDYMSSILNNYIGQGVIQNRKSLLQSQKEAAEATQNTEKTKYSDYVKSDASSLTNASLGRLAFGKDWDDPISKKVALDKVWGKEKGHVAAIDQAFQKHVSRLFDPYYDDKQDDYLKEGVDIKALRERYSNVYDSTSKTFKTPLKGIGDLYRYADILDTVSSDLPLFSKKDYSALNTPTPDTTPPINPSKPEVAPTNSSGVKLDGQEGNAFKGSDGRLYADKGLTRQINGKWTDGKYYSSGVLRAGKYAPTENGPNGKPVYNYYSPESGFYADGVKVNRDGYNTYIQKIQADPSRKLTFDRIMDHNRNIDQTYAEANFVPSMTTGFTTQQNILNDGRYAFKGFGAEFKPAGAANISSMFRRGDAPITGGVFSYQSNAENHLGIPDAETAIVTDDGYNFRGIMRPGADGKLRMFKRNPDNTLVENNDPNLKRFLDGLSVDESKLDKSQLTNMLLSRSRYAPPGKFQIGGRVQKKLAENDANVIKNNKSTQTQASNIKDIFKGDYKMSTQEKLEAGALAADLTSLGFTLTGAGSIPGAAIGAVATSAQLGADISRDGADLADFGKAALGYGLDVVSAVPGLGLIGKSSKTLNTIKRSAKWLIPVMAAAGATQAVGVVSDVLSGKKKITDLTTDDLRVLTNGLHAGVAGGRAINNAAATKKVTQSSLKLKEASVDLDPKQAEILNSLEGVNQQTQAKLFAIENLAKKGTNVSDVTLKEVKDGFSSKAKFWAANPKLKEVVEVSTAGVGRELKNIDDYQSNSWKDKYMRSVINKAAIRNPGAKFDLTDNGGERGKQWGFLGDYFRSNKVNSVSGLGAQSILPIQAVGLPSPSGKPLMGNNVRQIAQESVRPGAVIDVVSPEATIGVRFNNLMNRANAGKLSGDQTSMFKAGGVLKAQQGNRIPSLNAEPYPIPKWDINKALQIPQIIQDAQLRSLPLPFKGVTVPSRISPVAYNAKQPGLSTAGDIANGANISTDRSGGSWLKKLTEKVNTHDLSEFGRALATRAVNQRIDTRVEAPMLTAPTQIDIPVKGDLFKRASFYNQANSIQQRAGQATTSDGQLYALQNLAGGQQAAGLRLQGDAADYEAIDRSRQMAIQNNMQNNAARTDVANRNISTLANSKQAERAANNQKIGLVAQPLLSFWENKNAENLRKEAYDRQIDGQIALSGLSTQIGDIKRPLLARAYDLYDKGQSSKYSDAERKTYMTQYEAIQRQLEGLGTAGTNNALQLRKNLNYKAPGDYYAKYLTPAYAKGGRFESTFNKASVSAYKERLKDVRTELKTDAKDSSMSLKEIQKLINKALKF